MLSVLDSCLWTLELNIILTLIYFSFNSRSPESFCVVNPYHYFIIANKYSLTMLAECGSKFAEALDCEGRYTSFVSHGGRKRPAYVLVLYRNGKSCQIFQSAALLYGVCYFGKLSLFNCLCRKSLFYSKVICIHPQLAECVLRACIGFAEVLHLTVNICILYIYVIV